jgi:hypothetical protein
MQMSSEYYFCFSLRVSLIFMKPKDYANYRFCRELVSKQDEGDDGREDRNSRREHHARQADPLYIRGEHNLLDFSPSKNNIHRICV